MQLQSQEKNANAVPEEDMKRVIAVLNKKTQECEQLREVGTEYVKQTLAWRI